MRILESDSDRGWAVVLERIGYTLDEIDVMLRDGTYPEDVLAFRRELGAFETVGGVARRVFDRYGLESGTADLLLDTIESVRRDSTLTRGDLIQFIERGIEEGTTHDVHTSAGTDAVTVQTIHAAKGREYPIVILANVNRHRFPPRGGSGGVLQFDESVGIRQTKVYGEDHGHPHLYDNWRWDVLRQCLPEEHDEERWLLYVATTRAENHLVYAAGETPNTFIESLPVEMTEAEAEVTIHARSEVEQTSLPITVPTPDGPIAQTPHTLMREDVFGDIEAGRGPEFGTHVRDFAADYALGEDVEPGSEDEEHVRAFLDSLTGDLLVEEQGVLPVDVDGTRVAVSGIVDVSHVTVDRGDHRLRN